MIYETITRIKIIKTHKIEQNIPDGWIDPNIVLEDLSLNKIYQHNFIIPIYDSIDQLNEINLNNLHELKIHFVQTATNKYIYLILSFILFFLFICVFINNRKLY